MAGSANVVPTLRRSRWSAIRVCRYRAIRQGGRRRERDLGVDAAARRLLSSRELLGERSYTELLNSSWAAEAFGGEGAMCTPGRD